MTTVHNKLFFMNKENPRDDLSALAFVQNPIATLILDENSIIVKTNFAFDKLLGYAKNALVGKDISILASMRNEPTFYSRCYRNTMQSMNNGNGELYVLCNNGIHLLVRKNSANIISNGKQHYILTFENITEHRRLLEHYQHLATHDALTGVANRILLDENFKKAKHKATLNNQKMALLVCDINEFKQFNDRYGHELGDFVLKTVAKTLKKALGAHGTVCRYGGDEFVLIIENVADNNQIVDILIKIKATFPITSINAAEGYEINMSMGTACFPLDGHNFNQLLQIADYNMYQEKKRFYS